MSVFVIATFCTVDFDVWKAGFEARNAFLSQRGLAPVDYRVFRAVDNADEISIVSEFESLEVAERAIADTEGLRADLDSAGLVDYPAVFVGTELRFRGSSDPTRADHVY